MSFTKDIATPTGQIRYLIGDLDPTAPNFQDEELQGFYNMTFGSILMACAFALDSLASTAASGLQDIVLGSLKINEASKVEAIKGQADRFRQLEYDTPAWAVVEENLSGFNELTIIRNWVLRTEV